MKKAADIAILVATVIVLICAISALSKVESYESRLNVVENKTEFIKVRGK